MQYLLHFVNCMAFCGGETTGLEIIKHRSYLSLGSLETGMCKLFAGIKKKKNPYKEVRNQDRAGEDKQRCISTEI